MNKRIYLIILYLVTVFICIAAVSHHIGNAVAGCASCVSGMAYDIKTPFTKLSGNIVEEEFTESGYKEISLKGAIADLTISEGDDYSFTFRGDEELKPNVKLSGNRLMVEQPTVKLPDGSVNAYSTINITVPKGALENVDIDSAVGDVFIKDLTCDKVTAKLAVGKIEIKNLDCKEKTKINSSVGEIRISDSETGELDLDSSIGDIVLDGVKCEDADIDSKIGDVKVSGIKNDDYNFNVRCSLGDFKYNGKEYGKKHEINNIDAKYEFRVTSDIGDVTINAR